MIKLVKREDYSSEEEYQKAYKAMLEMIENHNRLHSSRDYTSDTTVNKSDTKNINNPS